MTTAAATTPAPTRPFQPKSRQQINALLATINQIENATMNHEAQREAHLFQGSNNPVAIEPEQIQNLQRQVVRAANETKVRAITTTGTPSEGTESARRIPRAAPLSQDPYLLNQPPLLTRRANAPSQTAKTPAGHYTSRAFQPAGNTPKQTVERPRQMPRTHAQATASEKQYKVLAIATLIATAALVAVAIITKNAPAIEAWF